jgi:uncharacterized LabA/DUF88 family protein
MRFRRFGAAATTAAQSAQRGCLAGRAIAFVDQAYLHRDGARALGVDPRACKADPRAIVRWLGTCDDEPLARVYWYAAAYGPADARYARQRRALGAIADLDLVQLRLGQIKETLPGWQQEARLVLRELGIDARRIDEHLPLRALARQKAVDTQLAIDLVRLAERGALGHALLLAGDGDFAPAVRVARDAGVTVTILAPTRFSVARTLRELADHLVAIPPDELAGMIMRHGDAPVAPAPDGAGEEQRPGPMRGDRAQHRHTHAADTGRGAPGADGRVFSEHAIVTTDGSGVRYVPFVQDGRVGYVVDDGTRTTTVYLSPSIHDGAGQATVVLCAGPHGDPARDTALDFHRPFAPRTPPPNAAHQPGA